MSGRIGTLLSALKGSPTIERMLRHAQEEERPRQMLTYRLRTPLQLVSAERFTSAVAQAAIAAHNARENVSPTMRASMPGPQLPRGVTYSSQGGFTLEVPGAESVRLRIGDWVVRGADDAPFAMDDAEFGAKYEPDTQEAEAPEPNRQEQPKPMPDETATVLRGIAVMAKIEEAIAAASTEPPPAPVAVASTEPDTLGGGQPLPETVEARLGPLPSLAKPRTGGKGKKS